MRKLLPPTFVAITSSLVTLALVARAPLLVALGIVLAVLTAAFVWREWQRSDREQRALDRMLGHLAEFRLPLPEGVQAQLPAVLQPLVSGYEAVFLEMHRRQAALAERVERYAFMEMHSEDMVMQVDADGLVKYVSPAVQTQLGYTPEELRGTRILELLRPSEVAPWVESLKSAAREHRAALLEGNWRRKDGRYVTLEMSLRHAQGLNGSVAGTIGMARN